mgnify:CR=1 FL=1
MRKFILFLFIVAAVVDVMSQKNEHVIVPDSGKAVVVVIRPFNAIGRGFHFPFAVDKEIFCVLRVKEYGYTNITPGEHWVNGSKFMEGSYEITMSQDKTLNLDFNSDHSDEMLTGKIFEAGKIYYYRTKMGLGSISIYARLEEISESEALKLIKSYKLSQKNKIRIETEK